MLATSAVANQVVSAAEPAVAASAPIHDASNVATARVPSSDDPAGESPDQV